MRRPSARNARNIAVRRRLYWIGDGDHARRGAVDGDIDRGGAVFARGLGGVVEILRVDLQLPHQHRIAERDGPAVNHPARALAGRRGEVADVAQREIAVFRGIEDRLRQRVLAAALDAGCEAQQFVFIEPGSCNDGDHFRLALGERPGLVDHQRVDALQLLQRLRVADQDPRMRAAADADHDRHRRGEAERAGTRNDQHRHRGNEAEGKSRLRSEHRPCRKRQQRRGDHRRHEPAGHLIREALDRRPRALRARHHVDDARQHGVAADFFRAQHQPAILIDGAADHMRAFGLADRHRFTGHHRLVDRRAALRDDAIDRNLLAGTDAQEIADRDGVERDILVAVLGDAPRGFRREAEQRADRAGGFFARAQFEHLPEQHQHGDDRRRLEIHRDRAVHVAKCRRKQLRR